MYRNQVMPMLARMNRVTSGALLFAVSVPAILATPVNAQPAAHRENDGVHATVTSVETSPGANGSHYLTTTVHLHNTGKKPIILGVEPGKVTSTDDRGNTYGVIEVRGLGEVAGARVDPKFVLPPEDGADALFELRWRGTAVFGTVFDLKLPLRVILPLEAGQYKLGAEHLLTFTGLKTGLIATPKEADSLPKNTVDAGPFTVEITRMTPSIAGNRRSQSATIEAKIKNTSDKPIILAHEGASSFGVDDQGNRFVFYSVSGMGTATNVKADPQFVLAPGEARNVQVTIWRRLAREVAGTQLTYYLALAQLEVLPANQIRTIRQYSLTFPRLAGLN